MREAEERVIFRNAVDRRLSGLQENPFLAQRIMNAEKGEIKVKKKLTLSMALVIVLLLIAVTALAVALLSPKEIVEQVAVLQLYMHIFLENAGALWMYIKSEAPCM